MGRARIVNNIGIGLVEGTFLNNGTTTANSTTSAFTESMLDDDQVAAGLIGGNSIAGLTTTYPLFGAVKALSEDQDSGHPARAVVQIKGVAQMLATSTWYVNAATVPMGKHNGHVYVMTTTNVADFITTRGKVINTHSTNRVDVLF